MQNEYVRGRDQGMILCLDCQLICQKDESICPRCGSRLFERKTDSLIRCWALVLTGMILYIPANLLPIMTVSKLGDGKPETIMSGIVTLLDKNMLVIAGLVFMASIIVPLFKLLVMLWLLLSIRFQRLASGHQMKAYRLIIWIGRWSMLDIFIISLLTGLVQYGQLGTVTAGPAAYAFASVVVVTMWAAKSFDPRLLWDAASKNNTCSAREPDYGK